MSDKAPSEPEQGNGVTGIRVAVACLVGLVGCTVVWLVSPYNNFILHLGYVSDSFLPIAGLFVLLVLVLGVNPLLRRIRPRWVLTRLQLVIVLGMVLVASVLPGQGLLRLLPYALGSTCVQVSGSQQLAEVYAAADLPPTLFPEPLGHGQAVPASDRLLGELLPGESIPWGVWLKPLLAWGVFLGFFGLMMVSMSMIVLPQWRHNERLSFPLIEVHNSLIDTPEPGRFFPALFRSRPFWIGAGVVFLLYVLYGLNQYFPERVPAIPLSWDLRQCFTEEPLNYLPSNIYRSRIYFLFVAIAFFMPTRIGFSIWFTTLAYGGYVMVGRAYVPPFHYGTISDHRSGAMLVLTVVILWLGRARWAQIGRSLVRVPASVGDRRDRKAALLFLAGISGMVAWFLWSGAQLRWALLFVVTGFMVCLVITRLVAETGIPFMRIYDCDPVIFMSMVPVAAVSPGSLFLAGVALVFFQIGSRVNGMTMATHSLALDEEEGNTGRQTRFALLLVVVLLIGLAVCGAAHVGYSYNYSVTLDGEQSPISPWGAGGFNRSNSLMLSHSRGQLPQPLYSRPAHIAFGVALAGGLQWACMAMPSWPLHPIGIIMVNTFYGNQAWAGIFLGWLLKVLLVRYGGSRLYRKAKPFFLGLIVGEVSAAVLWCIVPSILVALGKSYTAIHTQPL
ncbi:MAG: hypothetical protein HN742_00800 [Lentisphaerae bacterium]|nr:hypothetical protein [Lentisphaerota bacterium]MBT4816663.1 hypothetical protein [Lentisphaerota bacterium]MBT5606380.1 hypothetical protein [Lentisphaerota bacterium]MBT7056765.1 hypothetical protein [Lentisphaerota bacterium]MBT7840370.1 hypothetical protein [Lentisphaerota bacterium]